MPILFLFLVVSRLAATAENADDLEDPDELDDLEELEAEMTVSEDVKIVGRAQKFLRDLNDQTVHRVIDTHKYVLLLGYATWCTRSADLMPGFAAAATVLADEGSPVLLAKIDAIANPGAANRYGIKGFPSFLFFTNGTVQQHTGGHTRLSPFLKNFNCGAVSSSQCCRESPDSDSEFRLHLELSTDV